MPIVPPEPPINEYNRYQTDLKQSICKICEKITQTTQWFPNPEPKAKYCSFYLKKKVKTSLKYSFITLVKQNGKRSKFTSGLALRKPWHQWRRIRNTAQNDNVAQKISRNMKNYKISESTWSNYWKIRKQNAKQQFVLGKFIDLWYIRNGSHRSTGTIVFKKIKM